jgi:hypothetical protein
MDSDVIIAPAAFFLVGFVAWTIVTGLQRGYRLKRVIEFNSRLLDRIGSVKDFSEFVQTEAGAQFMRGLTTEPAASAPAQRILNAVQIGLVSLAVGFGMLFLSRRVSFESHDVLLVLGTVAASLGGGFLLSSGVSYRLALSLGLLKRVER